MWRQPHGSPGQRQQRPPAHGGENKRKKSKLRSFQAQVRRRVGDLNFSHGMQTTPRAQKRAANMVERLRRAELRRPSRSVQPDGCGRGGFGRRLRATASPEPSLPPHAQDLSTQVTAKAEISPCRLQVHAARLARSTDRAVRVSSRTPTLLHGSDDRTGRVVTDIGRKRRPPTRGSSAERGSSTLRPAPRRLAREESAAAAKRPPRTVRA